MGAGGKKPSMHEIAETRAAGRDEAFENIISKLKTAGADLTQDETHPLFTEIGPQELEVGSERVVQFNLNRSDFLLSRRVETHSLQGESRQKHLQLLETPRIKFILKRKPDNSQDWQVVDLEDIF